MPAPLQVCWDVPPIPDWLQNVAKSLDKKLPGLLPSAALINMAVVNFYERAGAKLLPHIDSLDLFQRPIISLRLLSDSAISFGAKMGRCNVKVGDLANQFGVMIAIGYMLWSQDIRLPQAMGMVHL